MEYQGDSGYNGVPNNNTLVLVRLGVEGGGSSWERELGNLAVRLSQSASNCTQTRAMLSRRTVNLTSVSVSFAHALVA